MNRLWNLPSQCLILGVKFYKVAISPLLGKNCRFTPTCSTYFIECVERYGAVRGSLKGAWRILRCNPFNPGGYDPVAEGEEHSKCCSDD